MTLVRYPAIGIQWVKQFTMHHHTLKILGALKLINCGCINLLVLLAVVPARCLLATGGCLGATQMMVMES